MESKGYAELTEILQGANTLEHEGEQGYSLLQELFKLSHAENSNIVSSEIKHGCTVHVHRVPEIDGVEQLTAFLENAVGEGTVTDCRFLSNARAGKLRGSAVVEFTTEAAARRACDLASFKRLGFMGTKLAIKPTHRKRENPTHIRQDNATLAANSTLHAGCLVSHDVLHELWTAENVKLTLDDSTKKLAIMLHLSGKNYKLEWHLRDIFDIHPCKIKDKKNSQGLLLKVWLAPQIYEQLPCASDIFFEDAFELFGKGAKIAWARTTDFSLDASIGQSFSYCVEMFEKRGKELKTLLRKLSELKDLSSKEKYLSIKQGATYSASNINVPILNLPCSLPFQLIFLVNALVQQGFLSGPNLNQTFFELIQPSNKLPLKHVIHVLNKLNLREDTCFNPEVWFRKQTHQLLRKKYQVRTKKSWSNDDLVEVRRVYVTPSRVYFLGPEAVVSNRVTRQFIDSIDNFLRVSFVEENYDSLSSNVLMILKKSKSWESPFSEQKQHTKVYERIIAILRDGISIGSKIFEFLAFSSSQLRENSVWMFASDGKTSATNIREWMGDFSGIRNVAKCAARMGQSFSSSTKAVDVYPNEVDTIPDIWDDPYTYCFSDGIGKISEDFATQLAKKCKLKRLNGEMPSLYQVRYRGYKGVVAVDPSSTYKLSLRDSMKKFPSKQIGLDILNWSHFIPSYLNRQIITLLSTLGVNDLVFERMQLKVMQRLDQMLDDGEVAMDIMQTFCRGDTQRVILDMISAGYEPSSEPFLKRMLYAFKVVQLMQLRRKTRIFVAEGRLLMGCLDEAAVLNYGEVFVSVSPRAGCPYKYFDDGLRPITVQGMNGAARSVCIVEGKVIVAKNPCLHPGDVRVLTAVNVPALHHLVDCIVFPQRGHRPHPNECSGSDLDGDLYFVSWDKELIPPVAAPPMDYQASPTQVQDHPVTIQEIQEYFVDFMTNDSLGLISNAHTVFADTEEAQAYDMKCLALAKLCSIAVDFPKTGIPAKLPVELRPRTYPDFMEKDDKTTYTSERVLGKLYRAVAEDCDAKMIVPFTKHEAAKFYDKELEICGFEQYVEEAHAQKGYYDEQLLTLMYQYDVKSEAEIFTGNIRSLSRFYQKRTGEVKERIQKSMNSLKKEARSWLRSHRVSMHDNHVDISPEYTHEELAKASAWYHVTYHPDYVIESNVYEGFEHEHLLSFPWVVHDRLSAIKKGYRLQMTIC